MKIRIILGVVLAICTTTCVHRLPFEKQIRQHLTPTDEEEIKKKWEWIRNEINRLRMGMAFNNTPWNIGVSRTKFQNWKIVPPLFVVKPPSQHPRLWRRHPP